jgi:hypothetical protein
MCGSRMPSMFRFGPLRIMMRMECLSRDNERAL